MHNTDDFDADEMLGKPIGVSEPETQDLELVQAREFFMAVLEAAEPDAYIRYTSIQIRFHDLVARMKQGHLIGAVDPDLISETHLAHGDLINAREHLDAAMARTSNLMAHSAHA
jgi:hypothetical protein